ncbi:MAG: hypothetical protein A2X11_09875 [Bacteroidetes bacterium GWE2_42_24]|nr:MAG: hypothetical protein A2X11_09875 [Bacteroidetes bacterium GWE2_42_24]OFY26196.1 MAG: hypothetical protein A2X09_05265 [Bacteroidetes bacterium GWF2_43_11]
MSFIADLHIHSRFSLATSKELTPPTLHLWARRKGIGLVGTGDCIHPKWLTELELMLEPDDTGLLKLKHEFGHPELKSAPAGDVRFVLTTEISNIYKRGGQVRKVHNILIFPDFEAARSLQQRLQRLQFNISSDGRPILGLDSRDLLTMLLEASPQAMLIPAHIWTPWFSALGAKSGFNSIAECYGELTKHIHAVETGLSSDAPMNWLISSLDEFTLIANSDAHSPEKLGRNANRLTCEKSYQGLMDALKGGPDAGFGGTIDMFPQEGKYHYAGHRKCNVAIDPAENIRMKGICPVCHKKLTEGVMDRIAQLADRANPLERPNRASFQYVIPLKEMLAQVHGCGESSKTVTMLYHQLLQRLGPELTILLDIPIGELQHKTSPLVAEAIRRMRSGEVIIHEGYDGEYGTIQVIRPGELMESGSSTGFFDRSDSTTRDSQSPLLRFDPAKLMELKSAPVLPNSSLAAEKTSHYQAAPSLLNSKQQQAVRHTGSPLLVLAGPGTGKTRVLTERIAWLINNSGIAPEKIIAVTFTQKAAREMQERTIKLITGSLTDAPFINTFHGWGINWLRQHAGVAGLPDDFNVAGDPEKRIILTEELQIPPGEIAAKMALISAMKQKADQPDVDEVMQSIRNRFDAALRAARLIDIDDLVCLPVTILQKDAELLIEAQHATRALLIDEYQDINAVQYELVKLLTADDPSKLFAIGDPNQSIYAFRGSDVAYINRFVNDFSGAVTYSLNESYRCPHNLLTAARQVIDNENQTIQIQGISHGTMVKITENPTEASESEFIARTIDRMTGGTRFFAIDSGIADPGDIPADIDPSQIAILTRTHRQQTSICKALNDHGIPWRSYHHMAPFAQKPASDLITILKALDNPQNNFYQRQATRFFSSQKAYGTFMNNFPLNLTISEQLSWIGGQVFPSLHEGYREMIRTSESFRHNKQTFWQYINTGIMADALSPDVTAVNLMTLHAAKGLEFDVVIIAGCEEGIIPYTFGNRKSPDPEEERRLLYVGMTRARNLLLLTHALERTIFGQQVRLPRSRFLDSISNELTEFVKQETSRKQADIQLSLF